ncbi:MAG: hypothetical protein K8S20_12610 [Chloroflexi bacterium]|nr:hypothetical protein [Chloroflexota bacterium]
MKIKNVVTLLVICTIVISCSPMVSSASPTLTEVPFTTSTVPVITNTPTQIPPTPTDTPLPTPEINSYEPTMIDFECTAEFSFDKIQKSDVLLSKNVHMSRWIPCTLPDGKVIAINMLVEDWNQAVVYFTFSGTGSSGIKGESFGDGGTKTSTEVGWGIAGMEESILDIYKIDGKRVRIKNTTGNMSGSLLLDYDAFKEVLTGELADRMITFAESSNTSVLPTFPGLPYPLALIYRTEIIEILP